MKLYYTDQRKMFPFLKPVEIWDEQGNVRYTLKKDESLKYAGYYLHLYDTSDKEVASVRQKLLTMTPKFCVNVSGKELTVCLKAPLKGSEYFDIGEIGWKTHSLNDRRTYEIKSGEQRIASVQHGLFDYENRSEIKFSDDMNEIEILSVVMAIEAAICVDSRNSSS